MRPSKLALATVLPPNLGQPASYCKTIAAFRSHQDSGSAVLPQLGAFQANNQRYPIRLPLYIVTNVEKFESRFSVLRGLIRHSPQVKGPWYAKPTRSKSRTSCASKWRLLQSKLPGGPHDWVLTYATAGNGGTGEVNVTSITASCRHR